MIAAQLFDCENSLALVPSIKIVLIFKLAVPLLDIVAINNASEPVVTSPNTKLVGAMRISG